MNDDSFGNGEWQAFDPEEPFQVADMETSMASDIELARDGDSTTNVSRSRLSLLNTVPEDMDMDEKAQPFEDEIDAFDALENDNMQIDVPRLSMDGNEFGISAPSPVRSHTSHTSRISIGLVSEMGDLNDENVQVTVKKKRKRKGGRDESTEISSEDMKKVRHYLYL